MQGDDAIRHFRAFLNALDLTPETDSELDRTPERFTQLLIDMSQGLRTQSPDISAFDIVDEIDHEPVLLIALPFSSLCVHHLLPFFGTIDVAYIPGPKMVGFGSIGRVIDHFAARPQVQDRRLHRRTPPAHRPARSLPRATTLHGNARIAKIRQPHILRSPRNS